MFWIFLMIVVNGIALICELKKEKEKRNKTMMTFSIACIIFLLICAY